MFFLPPLFKASLLLLGWYSWSDSGSFVLWSKKVFLTKTPTFWSNWMLSCGTVVQFRLRTRTSRLPFYLADSSVWHEINCCCHQEHMTQPQPLVFTAERTHLLIIVTFVMSISDGAPRHLRIVCWVQSKFPLSGSHPGGLDIPDLASNSRLFHLG